MKLAHLAAVLAALTNLLMGCADAARSVEPPILPPVEESARLRPTFPALSRAGEIYAASDSLYDLYSAYHGYVALASRFVLYPDDTFALQFSSLRAGFFEYAGLYSRADSLITFYFDGSSTAGAWRATGALSRDALTVAHNDVMHLADFLDGVYLRAGASQ